MYANIGYLEYFPKYFFIYFKGVLRMRYVISSDLLIGCVILMFLSGY